MKNQKIVAGIMAIGHMTHALQVAQSAGGTPNGFEGRWYDDCIVASFDEDHILIEDHCGGEVRWLDNWEAGSPLCPYYDKPEEVCKKEFLKASDIPEGYKAMSLIDVRLNWDACRDAMGAWDIISLLDG